MTQNKETAWVKNPHGVVVALPKYLAEWRVSKFPGWSYTEPEAVPAVKQYPMEGELTEQGERRRMHRQERTEVSPTTSIESASVAPADTVAPEAVAESGDRDLTREEYMALDWQPLRSYARSRGIDVDAPGSTKEAILAELDKGSAS